MYFIAIHSLDDLNNKIHTIMRYHHQHSTNFPNVISMSPNTQNVISIMSTYRTYRLSDKQGYVLNAINHVYGKLYVSVDNTMPNGYAYIYRQIPSPIIKEVLMGLSTPDQVRAMY
jgi:cytochrome c biogenesis factor